VAQSVENEEVREAVNYYELEKYLPLGLMGKKILLKVQEEQLPFDPLGKNHRLIARGSKCFLSRAEDDEEGDVSVKVGRGNTRKEFENLRAWICNFGQITKKLDWAFGLVIKGLGLKHSGLKPWLGSKRKMGIQKKWADCLKGCGLGQKKFKSDLKGSGCGLGQVVLCLSPVPRGLTRWAQSQALGPV
jgi:hypothetical protein